MFAKFSPVLKAELLLLVSVIIILALGSYRQVNDETRLFLSGELSLEKVLQLEQQLKSGQGRWNTLQLSDSPGAGAAAGMIVERMEVLLNRYRLNTEVRGFCVSACAAIFLLGQRRQMLATEDHSPTYLMLHAIRNNQTREVNYGKTETINRKIAARSLGQFSIKLLSRMFDDKRGTGDGEIYLFRDPQPSTHGHSHLFICDSQRSLPIQQCEIIKRITPQSLGVIVVGE